MTTIIPDPVVTNGTTPPQSVDVVIVGGGIIGSSTAYFLAEAGISVALCEKGLIGAEQSGRNWGWVRQMGRDISELPLAMESLRIWSSLNDKLGAETGFRRTGITYVCETDRQAAEYEEWVDHARTYQIDSRMLPRDELEKLLPGISPRFRTGLYTASDGRAEPLKAAPAIANAAMRKGAHILTNCAVRGVETSGGRVSGVVTEHGHIACSTVVLAGGAWTRLLAGTLGISFPQLRLLGTVARIGPVDGVPDMPVGGADFSFRRRLDGGFTVAMRNANVSNITPESFRQFGDYLPALFKQWRELKLRFGREFVDELRIPRRWPVDSITPFERQRVLDPAPYERFNTAGIRNLIAAFPAFANAKIQQTWGGLIDVTPDAVPVIGPADSLPGLYLASGFSGHGFGIGPGAGKLMSEIVRGTGTCVDPAPFSFNRFNKKAARAANR